MKIRKGVLRILACVAVCSVMFASRIYGATLFVEGGRFENIFVRPGAQATIDMISIEGEGALFPVASAGIFARGEEEVFFCSLGVGAKRSVGERWYVSAKVASAFIDHETERLGTNLQFHLGLFAGFEKSGVNVRIGIQHLSNGSNVFGTTGPNIGEDFITIGIGVKIQ